MLGIVDFLGKGTFGFLKLISELVIQELEQENLSDNLVFVAIVAESVDLTCGFEVIDKTYGFSFIFIMRLRM